MATGIPGELFDIPITAVFQNATNGDQSVSRDVGTENPPAVVFVMTKRSWPTFQ
jgi:hypothetical protein